MSGTLLAIPIQVKTQIKKFWTTFKKALGGWNQDKATTLCAALAYYTVFSIAPRVLIAIAVAGLFHGQDATRGEIFKQIEGLIGADASKSIQSIKSFLRLS